MSCLSNERQFSFALHQYFTDWGGAFPLSNEYFFFPNEGRSGRSWVDFLGFYLGITSTWDLGPVGSFAGYVVRPGPYPAVHEILVDPGRDPLEGCTQTYRNQRELFWR